MMVIGSFASYTKTKSEESAVWCLLTLDDDDVGQLEQVTRNGIEIPEQGQVQNCSIFFSNNNQNKNSMKMKQKVKQRIILSE